jgi:hypothetical protein
MNLLLNAPPAKPMPTLWRTMWTKYDYLCTNCDTLIEITTLYKNPEDPYCVCSESAVIGIGTSPGNVPIITDVSKVTP